MSGDWQKQNQLETPELPEWVNQLTGAQQLELAVYAKKLSEVSFARGAVTALRRVQRGLVLLIEEVDPPPPNSRRTRRRT